LRCRPGQRAPGDCMRPVHFEEELVIRVLGAVVLCEAAGCEGLFDFRLEGRFCVPDGPFTHFRIGGQRSHPGPIPRPRLKVFRRRKICWNSSGEGSNRAVHSAIHWRGGDIQLIGGQFLRAEDFGQFIPFCRSRSRSCASSAGRRMPPLRCGAGPAFPRRVEEGSDSLLLSGVGKRLGWRLAGLITVLGEFASKLIPSRPLTSWFRSASRASSCVSGRHPGIHCLLLPPFASIRTGRLGRVLGAAVGHRPWRCR